MFIIYPKVLLNWFISPNSVLLCGCFKFFIYKVMSSVNRDSFTSSSAVSVPFICLFFLAHLLWLEFPVHCWIKAVKMGIRLLFLILGKGKALSYLPLSIMWAVGFPKMLFIMLRKFLILQICWIFLSLWFFKSFFCIKWDDYVVFPLHSITIVYYTDFHI